MESRRWMVVVGLASLLGVLALRIYALESTVSIRTWDDEGYRHAAVISAARTDVRAALGSIALPEHRSMATLGFFPRSIGYHAWLVVGLKIIRHGDVDRICQDVNVVLFAVQLLLIVFLCRRNRFEWGETLCITSIYAGSPMVFGMNRWVLTENHVFAAMLAVFAVTMSLMTWKATSTTTPRRIAFCLLHGATAGYVVGVFSTLREYAAPYFFAVAITVLIALIVHRRFLTAGAFVVVLAPFLLAAADALPPVIEVARRTAADPRYHHPFGEWLGKAIVTFFGIPITAMALWAVYEAGRTLVSELRPMEGERSYDAANGTALTAEQIVRLFVLALVVLAAVQLHGLVHLVIRAGVPIIFLCVGLFFVVTANDRSMQRFRRTSKYVLLGSVAITWGVLIRQTMLPEVPGARFRHHCTNLETYDYPFGLPRLPPGAMHTTCPF